MSFYQSPGRTVLVNLLDDGLERRGGHLDAHHAQDVAHGVCRDEALLVLVEALEGASQDDNLFLLQASLLLKVVRAP